MKAKIGFLDIETRPIEAYVWGIWDQNIGLNQIIRGLEIMTYSFKWLGEEEVYWDSVEKDKDERRVLETLWEFLDEADIIVTHNGDRFDVPIINSKFLEYEIKPYSPFKRIDTLKVLKSQFRLTSNRLDYASKYMGFEGKLATGGMQLWIDCINGKKEAWEKMVNYNIQDVIVLEEVYEKILPWIRNHPNVSLYDDEDATVCPKCGGSSIQFRGYYYTAAGKFHRFQCKDCGGWGRVITNLLSKKKRKGLARNVPT